MRRLIAAIGAMLSAMRTVWTYCGKAGRLVARTVMAPLAGGASMPPMPDEEPPAASVAAADQDLANIRKLAGAMAADRVTGADLSPVADARIDWLMAMDRTMLARVLYADDAALKAHLRGERSIRGVLAADAESVAAYFARMAMVPDDYDDAPAPVMAFAA